MDPCDRNIPRVDFHPQMEFPEVKSSQKLGIIIEEVDKKLVKKKKGNFQMNHSEVSRYIDPFDLPKKKSTPDNHARIEKNHARLRCKIKGSNISRTGLYSTHNQNPHTCSSSYTEIHMLFFPIHMKQING